MLLGNFAKPLIRKASSSLLQHISLTDYHPGANIKLSWAIRIPLGNYEKGGDNGEFTISFLFFFSDLFMWEKVFITKEYILRREGHEQFAHGLVSYFLQRYRDSMP